MLFCWLSCWLQRVTSTGKMPYSYDILYWLLIIIIPLAAELNVKLTYSKYSKERSRYGLSAEKAARRILDGAGLQYIRLDRISGDLTDRYEPNSNRIRLSDTVNSSQSIAAIGVAAHECGHAMQYAENYTPILVRSKILPVTNFCSKSWYYIVILGALFSRSHAGHYIMLIGVMMFAMIVLFQLATLPVEIDASRRALRVIEQQGILEADECRAAKKVLTAAALTYVASLLTGVLQLIRIVMMTKRNDSRRR